MVMVSAFLSPYNTFYLTTVISSDFNFPFSAIKRALTLQARSKCHQTRAGKWPGRTKIEGRGERTYLPKHLATSRFRAAISLTIFASCN